MSKTGAPSMHTLWPLSVFAGLYYNYNLAASICHIGKLQQR